MRKIYEKYLTERIDWEKNQLDAKKLKRGSKVKILRGKYKGKIGEVTDWHDEDNGEPAQIDVSINGKIRYLEKNDVEWV